ncbi:TPA: restriction endonuclease subunit S [Vibrio vulnificus]|nr:restriction endonuclease subunit S [Vibrio vulnificus]MCU8114582.1 restriction endonuclease subunit S [Vibrio vulnificus]MCU8308252.1 restriction endonuclease subunit S [Vibrio vulnificus]
MSAEKLITDHIAIWTSAVQAKSASGRGSSKKRELYGIKKLRELILELAVRGKLVPQDPNDEPASVLLERIAAEKAQLVKENKIKKPKKLPEITEDDIPFKLPEGWTFSRLENLCELITKGSSPKWQGVSYTENPEDVLFVTSENVGAFELLLDKKKYVEKKFNEIEPRSILRKDDFLMNIVGASIGRTALYNIDYLANINQAVCLIRSFPQQVITRFFLTFFNSLTCVSYMYDKQVENARPNLSMGNISKFVIPVPPFNEQHRIVAKVDELMALCDQLEQQTEASLDAHQVLVETLLATLTNSQDATELMANWARISEHFDTLFTTEQSIDQLKQTILQLAVMGKLVAQDPNDEPAAILLERIAEEKAQLVKEKKIKKQKALPPITEDEKPFELPSGWEWARIFDVSLFSEYGSSEKTVTELPDGVPVLKMGDIQAGKVILGEHQVVSSQIEDLPNLYLKLGDVLYNRTNSAELVGKTGMFEGEDDVYTFASYLIRIRCSFNNLMPEYLNLSMNTPLFRKTQIEPHIKQQCGQANVNGTLMKSMLVSVPPVREQARLIAKTKELLSFCDQLKQRLRDSQQTQLQLTDAIVEQVL